MRCHIGSLQQCYQLFVEYSVAQQGAGGRLLDIWLFLTDRFNESVGCLRCCWGAMTPDWGQAAPRWLSYIVSACSGLLDDASVACRGACSASGSVSGAACKARAYLLDSIAPATTSTTCERLVVASVLAAVVPATVMLYFAFLRRSSRGPTPSFNRLRSKVAGAGKQGGKWTIKVEPPSSAAGSADNGSMEGGVTWLGETELRVLEAFSDTLLPGFEVHTAESADAAVDEVCMSFFLSLFFVCRSPLYAA